jgi:hypothetical protein
MTMRASPLLPVLLIAASHAGDTPEAQRPLTILDVKKLEEEWRFTPPPQRNDPLYDLEAIMSSRRGPALVENRGGTTPGTSTQAQEEEVPVAWARTQKEAVDVLGADKKWGDAMRAADAALKALDKHRAHPEIAPIVAQLEQSRGQYEDALTRDEAQGEFAARALKVLGILWSEKGQRLALIDGEPKAVGLNERIKDCVIINIDKDRVDFRFHWKRRRFEFPVYVGEAAGSASNPR